ncbi:MAG: hypothetical protein LBL91_01510 [Lachnospiraceae bacterium]|jgi:HD superfamily phosphohydrolase|nr:hypothetical protein [Lachnospiraceae bacterium]
MNNYFNNLNPIIKEYFSVLSSDIPEFLYEYINTKELQRINNIGQDCGTYYTKIYRNKFYYTVLDHSIGVALIIWHFTKDKKQTLAGLFHDIATPVFKHCIDFFNKDYEKQESTEELTTKIISDSKEIMALLKRDGIKLEEVNDYKLYPIADNEMPRLSADRIEYTLSGGLYFVPFSLYENPLLSIEKIKKFYNNLIVIKNEENVDEIAVKDAKIAEEFINTIDKQWYGWVNNDDKIIMQFIADIIKKMIEGKYLTLSELHIIPERELIDRIENCPDITIQKAFEQFRNTEKIGESDVPVENKYCISLNSKIRYLNPLVKTSGGNKRIHDISKVAKEKIDDYLAYKTKKYAYLNFNM